MRGYPILNSGFTTRGFATGMARALIQRPQRAIAGFDISESEIADAVAFLQLLTDMRFLKSPAYAIHGDLCRHGLRFPRSQRQGRAAVGYGACRYRAFEHLDGARVRRAPPG